MIIIKTPQEIQIMREGGWLLAKIIEEVADKVKPGVTTAHLNKVAQDLVFALRRQARLFRISGISRCALHFN